jgi:hypothetical protein
MGAPWDAIQERATELAAAVSAVRPPATDRTALREQITEALMRWAERGNDPQYASIRRPAVVRENAYSRADAVLAVLPAVDQAASEDDGEGDELVCVDECGFCDACGMEPFGTPAEGWREAAHFLRRTARESGDRQGALHGASLIEEELRRRAEPAAVVPDQADDEAPCCSDPTCVCDVVNAVGRCDCTKWDSAPTADAPAVGGAQPKEAGA